MSEPASMLEAALAYAERGHAVFPVSGKAPLTEHGFKDATLDPETIRRWWSDHPGAGIGSPVPPGQIVLDVDPRNGGNATFDRLLAKCGPLPATVTKVTGGDGRHLHFGLPESFNGSGVRTSLGPGLDVKVGGKGYTILPPSPHPSGVPYAWAPYADPEEQVVALLPGPWVEELRHGEHADKSRTAPIPEEIREGARNRTLASLAGSMRRRGASEEAILAAIRAENENRCKPRLPDDEVRKIAASIANYSPAERVVAIGGVAVDASDTIPPPVQLTDLGNARRLISRHGSRFHYLCDRRKWICWDGRRWTEDDRGEIKRAAKGTIEAIFDEARGESNDERRNELRRFALRSQSAQRLAGMVELAQSELPMPMRSTDFDRNPWLLNVLNGTLDLNTATLRSHSPEDLISKVAPVEFDPAAVCPTWDAFLIRIMAGNASLIGFLRRAAGYSLTGDISEQCFFIGHGGGSNGKSTFLNTLRGVLGDGEYALHTPIETLLSKRDSGGPSNDLARLRGARFVSAIEGDRGRHLAESRVKQLTGGDPVTARYLFAEFFEYVPTYKLWLGVNHRPRIAGTDVAIWRRIRLVPFTTTIQENERDPRMVDKLLAESSGILNWCLEGALERQAKGLATPEEVKRATDAYREEEDSLAPFFEDCCEIDANAWTSFRDLYQAYSSWAERMGEQKTRSARAFSAALDERGLECDRENKARPRRGIRLTSRAPER